MPDSPRPPEHEIALEALLHQYGRLLRSTIRRLCPRHLGIEFDDIEQEARLRLWRALSAATEITHPASYIYRAAASATLDAIRRVLARREDPLDLDSGSARGASGEPIGGAETRGSLERPSASVAPVAHERLRLREAAAALEQLPADQRRAVGLHLRGFTPPEIAALLAWSEPKARSTVYRGLAALRTQLGGRKERGDAGDG